MTKQGRNTKRTVRTPATKFSKLRKKQAAIRPVETKKPTKKKS